ncbi:MAG: transcriptional regulator BetI, partial [Roseivivax sp.]|nr:transcriptional regulator BetI [Roseivivax sp.]
MPRIGMEFMRRAALVEAAVAEIGGAGSLDVTVTQIAKRAGMSSALAHHYFGGKDQMFLAAMRHILQQYSAEVARALAGCAAPRDRLAALIGANFAPAFFDAQTAGAWLQFYVHAQANPDAARLLRVYH